MTAVTTAATAALVNFSSSAAKEVENAFSKVISGTGLSGSAADEIKKSFESIATTTSASLSEAASAIANIQTLSGMMGNNLEKVTESVLKLSQVTGESANEISSLLVKSANAWGQSLDTKKIDAFLTASQASGISVAKLAENMARFEPVLSSLGYSFEESISLIANFERSGLDVEKTLNGMSIAARSLARETVSLGSGSTNISTSFASAIEKIKQAKTETEAYEIALKYFGRSAVDITNQVKSGAFSYDSLYESIKNSVGALEYFYKETETTEQKMQRFLNTAKISLTPIGDIVQDAKRAIIDFGTDLVGLNASGIKDIANSFREGFSSITSEFESFDKIKTAFNFDSMVGAAKSAGESIGNFLKAILEIDVSKTIDTLTTLAKVIFTGFAVSKIASVVSSILSLASAFTSLLSVFSSTSTISAFSMALTGLPFGAIAAAVGPAVIMINGLVQSFKDGTSAANAYKDAIKLTAAELSNMSAETLKNNITLIETQISSMRQNMGGPNSSRTGDNEQIKSWIEQLDKYKKALEEVEKKQSEMSSSSVTTETAESIKIDVDSSQIDAANNMIEDLKQSVSMFKDASNQSFYSVKNSVVSLATQYGTMKAEFSSSASAAEAAARLTSSSFQEVSSSVSTAASSASTLDSAFSSTASNISSSFNSLNSSIFAFTQNISSISSSLGQSLSSAITSLPSTFNGVFTEITSSFSSFSSSFFSGLDSLVSDFTDKITEASTNATSTFSSSMEELVSLAGESGAKTGDAWADPFLERIEKAVRRAKALMASV